MKIFKNDIVRLCLSLLLIAGIVALVLGGVNMITKDRIAALEAESELNTVRQFYAYDSLYEKAELVSEEDGTVTEYFKASKPMEQTEEEIAAGVTPVAGDTIGYAVTVSENGYGGEIKMLVAFDVYGHVNGIGVISMSETSGVGTRIQDDSSFFTQFAGKIGPFKFTKSTAQSKTDIVAINGASISSKAAVGAVNKAVTALDSLFIDE